MTTLGCLLTMVLLLVFGYIGYKLGFAYWDQYQVKEKVRETLTWAVAGQAKYEGEITKRLIASVKDAGLIINPENVRITQTTETMTIKVFWTREIEFPVYSLPLNFEVTLTEIKRWGRGGLVIK
jgi:hypothetical protein